MLKKSYIYLFIFYLVSSPLYADDLDDGIGIDEAIDDKLQLEINIDYIKRSAIAKARRAEAKGNSGCSGIGNQSFGPGANLKGATIVNLSDNKGTSSVCIDK